MSVPAERPRYRPAVAPERRAARDRVLLYIRGLDLPPAEGVSLAARSLEEASTSPAEAMDVLERLLQEEGLLSSMAEEREKRLSSFPPLNRSVMVAEEMDRLPWRTSFIRFLRRWRRELFGGGASNG